MSEDLEFKGTPGPWKWSINNQSKRMELSGRGVIVMDFVRWGMRGAVARLRDLRESLMYSAAKWAKPVTGREHHANWYQGIDHPDMRLIEASPDLLEFAFDCFANYDCDTDAHKYGTRCRKCEAERVIKLALGVKEPE